MHPPRLSGVFACMSVRVSHTPHKGQSAPVWKEDSDSKENTFYLPLETSAFQGWWGRWEGMVFCNWKHVHANTHRCLQNIDSSTDTLPTPYINTQTDKITHKINVEKTHWNWFGGLHSPTLLTSADLVLQNYFKSWDFLKGYSELSNTLTLQCTGIKNRIQ